MHDVDGDNDWISTLDWSAYRRPHTDYVSKAFFLPGVAEMFARHLCAPWPTEIDLFLSHAGNTPPGRIVQAEDAFAADGTPIHSVHRRLDATMRAHADDLEIAIARSDVITFAEWQEICDAGDDLWHLGQGARRAVNGLAPIIARLAAEERIRCHARPINGGGDRIPIVGRTWWDMDPEQAVRRMAAAAIDPSSPFDEHARPTHRIFVEREGLQNAIYDAQRKEYVAIAFLEFGRWALRRPADHYAVQVAEVTAFLVQLMESGHYEHAINEDFQFEVEQKFGKPGLGRCYERAKAAAIADERRARFGRRRPADHGTGKVADTITSVDDRSPAWDTSSPEGGESGVPGCSEQGSEGRRADRAGYRSRTELATD
ncbi:hypothetical protein [Sphingomonas sp. Leaf4]|uniref:hypothetical protein n=1 Tax=Sphingomonas sp. Leaf4 TaxID=2876553 RepID=UPI001E5C4956|nr:hypothetical protein [Sphingomonas sp. Leaf4]